jgi:hypothetical protein
MHVISLPYVVDKRSDVRRELSAQETPADLSGEQVVVVCLYSAVSAKAADALVTELLERRHADGLHVVGASRDLIIDLYESVVRRRLAHRVTFHPAPVAESFGGNARSASRTSTNMWNAACSAAAAEASRATA